MVKSRMMLVVVGNLPRARLERLVRQSFATLPAGAYEWKVPAVLGARAGLERVHPHRVVCRRTTSSAGGVDRRRDTPTRLRCVWPRRSSRAGSSPRCARERNLTYAVEAKFRDRALTSGGLYVTTTQPDTTLAIMRNELRNLQSITIRTEYLQPLVQQFITEYFLDNETSGAQADFLARAELYRGDFRAGDRFVADLRAVTGEDVRRVARDLDEGHPVHVHREPGAGEPLQVDGVLGAVCQARRAASSARTPSSEPPAACERDEGVIEEVGRLLAWRARHRRPRRR